MTKTTLDYMYVHVSVCVCTCTCICMCVCTCTCTFGKSANRTCLGTACMMYERVSIQYCLIDS